MKENLRIAALGATVAAIVGFVLGFSSTRDNAGVSTAPRVWNMDSQLDSPRDAGSPGSGQTPPGLVHVDDAQPLVPPAGREAPPTFDGLPASGKQAAAPEKLPPSEHASPLDATTDQPRPDLRKIIQKELPQATPDEVEVWMEELKDLPVQMAQDVLKLRSRFGGLDKTPPSPEEPAPPAAGLPESQSQDELLRQLKRLCERIQILCGINERLIKQIEQLEQRLATPK